MKNQVAFILLILALGAFAFTVSDVPYPSSMEAGGSYTQTIGMSSTGPFNISFDVNINNNTNTSEFGVSSPDMSCNSNGTDWLCGNYSQLSAGDYKTNISLSINKFLAPTSITVFTNYAAYADEPEVFAGAPVVTYYSSSGSGGDSGGSGGGSSSGQAYYTPGNTEQVAIQPPTNTANPTPPTPIPPSPTPPTGQTDTGTTHPASQSSAISSPFPAPSEPSAPVPVQTIGQVNWLGVGLVGGILIVVVAFALTRPQVPQKKKKEE